MDDTAREGVLNQDAGPALTTTTTGTDSDASTAQFNDLLGSNDLPQSNDLQHSNELPRLSSLLSKGLEDLEESISDQVHAAQSSKVLEWDFAHGHDRLAVSSRSFGMVADQQAAVARQGRASSEEAGVDPELGDEGDYGDARPRSIEPLLLERGVPTHTPQTTSVRVGAEYVSRCVARYISHNNPKNIDL